MYLLQPVTSEFRSGLNKLLVPIKNTKIGKVVRNVVASLKRKFKVKSYQRRTKSGKTITVNVDKTNVPNTISKVANTTNEPSKYLVLNMPVHKYKGSRIYNADDLYSMNDYRTISDKPMLIGKNVNKQWKATRSNASEYDSRLLNINITKAPKEVVHKLRKGSSHIERLDAYRSLEKLGLLTKQNVKSSRRYKVGVQEGEGFYFKSTNKLSRFML